MKLQLPSTPSVRTLADIWGLTPPERAQLVGDDQDLDRYEDDPLAVPAEVQMRWGLLLTIHRLRKALMSVGDQAKWVRRRDDGGELVIDLLMSDPRRLEGALDAELANVVVEQA